MPAVIHPVHPLCEQVFYLMKNKWLLLLLILPGPLYAIRSSIVVFPLSYSGAGERFAWISYVIPEYFSRKLGTLEGIRVWDPQFLFPVDSSGWQLQSDSLLLYHQKRWQWDAAIGGSYSVENDSVDITLEIVQVSATSKPLRVTLRRRASMQECGRLCSSLIVAATNVLHIKLPPADSLRITVVTDVLPAAYHTYCSGYGFELQGRYEQALTAYSRAVELDPSYTLARCRLGKVYWLSMRNAAVKKKCTECMTSRKHNITTSAFAADFAVELLGIAAARKYINEIRSKLEETSAGLAVIGKLYLASGEYQRAISILTRAVAWGPADLDAEFLLGIGYLRLGDYSSALDIFIRLNSIRPDYPRFQVSLGATYRSAGRLMESLTILEAAFRKQPDNTAILIELAHTCFALEWYRKAGQFLEHANKLAPAQGEILVNLGVVYWHENRKSEAKQLFTLAAKQASSRQASLTNQGTIALLVDENKKAIAAYRKAEKAGVKNPTILYNLAVAYRNSGNIKRAARYFDELLLIMPGRMDLLVERAEIAQQLGKAEDAEAAYRGIIDIDRYNTKAIIGLVRILFARKAYKEAIDQIEKYLEYMPVRADLMVILAEAYREQAWFEVAIVTYEEIVHNFPKYAEGYLGVARCMYDIIRVKGTKNYDEALYALKQASGYAPDNPEPYFLMGDIYQNYKGYKDMAAEQWRSAVSKAGSATEKRAIEKRIKQAMQR